MATDVVMPQMGESIAEGTIVRWIKKVGDTVDRDEPLFEISTDKVDAEIPSPAAGVLTEIRVKEGETVAGQQRRRRDRRRPAKRRPPPAAGAPSRPAPQARRSAQPPAPQADRSAAGAASGRRRERRRRRPRRHAASTPRTRPQRRAAGRAVDGRDALRQRSSPLVRKIAKEHNVDISQIHGTGIGGRVTKDDILGVHRQVGAGRPRPAAARSASGRAGDSGARCRRPAPQPPADVEPRRRRSRRADVGDAQEDRRAHGAEPAHVGARALGVRGELHAGRADSRGEEGRVRARRREAHLPVVHRQGGRSTRCAPCRSSTRRSTATTSSTTRTSTSASRSRSTGA